MASQAPVKRGGGKFNKPKRHDGKQHSHDILPTNEDGTIKSMWAEDDNAVKEEDEKEKAEESSGSEESEDGGAAVVVKTTELTRKERNDFKKNRKQVAMEKKTAVQVGEYPSSSEDDIDEEDEDEAQKLAKKSLKGEQKAIDSDDDDDKEDSGVSGLTNNPNRHVKSLKSLESASGKKVTIAQLRASEIPNRKETKCAQATAKYNAALEARGAGENPTGREDIERLRKIREERKAAAAKRLAENPTPKKKATGDKVAAANADAAKKGKNGKSKKGQRTVGARVTSTLY